MSKSGEYQSDKDFFENNPILKEIVPAIKYKQEEESPIFEISNNNPEIIKEITDRDLTLDEILRKPIMSGKELMSLPFETNDYLIENFLWAGDIAIVLAPEKAGKSFFSFQMAYALTCGEAFLGTFDVARPLNVLYIQAEGSLHDTIDRINKATSENGVNWDIKRWGHMFPPALSLDTEEGYAELSQNIQDYIMDTGFRPEVIIIDPLYMAMEGDLSDNKAARMFCRNVRKIKDKLNCAFLITHHQHRGRKDSLGNDVQEGDNAIMGSFVWKAFATHVLRVFHNKNTEVRTVTCDTQRNSNVEKEVKLILQEEPLPLILSIIGHKPSGAVEENVLKYLQTSVPISARDLAKETGMDYNAVRYVYTKLTKNKVIEIAEKQGKKVLYRLIKGENVSK